MTPFKTALASSVAAIALMTGPAMAQSDTSSTLGNGSVDATTSSETTARTDANGDTLEQNVEQGVTATGEAVQNGGEIAGDALSDTADAAGNALQNGAETVGEAASDTAEALSPDSAATADAEAQVTAEAGPTTVGTLIGSNVASSAGEDIGEIDDVVRINGELMAVVGVGGFLGLGEHSVALPLTELDWQGETVTAFGYTEEQLKSMKEYDAELATKLESDEQITLGKS